MTQMIGAGVAPWFGARIESGAGRTIEYNPRKLLITVVLNGLLALLGVALAGHARGFGGLIWGLIVLLIVAYAALALVKLFGDRVALRFDAEGLTAASFVSRRSAPWSAVGEITFKRTRLYAYGFIPVSRSRTTIKIPFGKGRFAKRVVLECRLLDLGAEALPALASDLRAMQTASVFSRSDGPGLAASKAGSAKARADFDPDAAIARYIASRRAETAPTGGPTGFQASGGQPAAFGRRRR